MIRKLTIAFGLSLLCVSLTLAQGGDCPDIVQTALAQVGDVCANTGRNQACYGNGAITAQFAPAANVKFDAPGDLGDLAAVQILQLGALDEDTGTWGVAMLKVQANLPDTNPGQNVTMLLFGDVQFADAAAVDGATPDPNADPDATFNPMQAFYFTAGIGDSPCAEAPDSGILIQTPQGAGTITLSVNGMDVTLGSTAYLQGGAADGDLIINLLEGEGTASVGDSAYDIPAGAQLVLPVDDTGAPVGDEGVVQPYDDSAFAALPLDLLPDPIVPVPPVDPASLGGAAGDLLQLEPGTYTITYGSLAAQGCGFDVSMLPALPDITTDITGADVQQVIDQLAVAATGGTGGYTIDGINFTVTSPSTNVYLIEYNVEGTVIVSTLTIISTTQFSLSSTITSPDGCVLSVDSVGTKTG